jgi:hypothetical protein
VLLLSALHLDGILAQHKEHALGEVAWGGNLRARDEREKLDMLLHNWGPSAPHVPLMLCWAALQRLLGQGRDRATCGSPTCRDKWCAEPLQLYTV